METTEQILQNIEMDGGNTRIDYKPVLFVIRLFILSLLGHLL